MSSETGLTNLERDVIRTALERMFKPDGYLDICTLDDLTKLARVMVPERTRATLRALHCVHWREMRTDTRDEIAQMIVGLFALPEFVVSFAPPPPPPSKFREVYSSAAPPEKRGLLLRLLGRAS